MGGIEPPFTHAKFSAAAYQRAAKRKGCSYPEQPVDLESDLVFTISTFLKDADLPSFSTASAVSVSPYGAAILMFRPNIPIS